MVVESAAGLGRADRCVVAALSLGSTISQTIVAVPLVLPTCRICGRAAVQGTGHAALAGLAARAWASGWAGRLRGRVGWREAAVLRRGRRHDKLHGRRDRGGRVRDEPG
jgi:hypothetical protein